LDSGFSIIFNDVEESVMVLALVQVWAELSAKAMAQRRNLGLELEPRRQAKAALASA
jgi:hypothetical protein